MKARPNITIISPDGPFIDKIAAEIGETCDVIACSNIDEVRESLAKPGAEAVVVDARKLDDGGHSLDRFIEELLEKHSKVVPLAIVDADCPEIIERRIACSSIQRFTAADSFDSLIETIADKTTNRDEAQPTPVTFGSSDDGTDAEVVLRGVTRQFETKSAQLKAMLEDLAVAAEHDVTILLIGETGSGKTFLSRLIHEASPRRNQPFLHVACGALPRELIETELFGHAKGSFTSAHADKEGKFVAAKKGTVLLDEIDVLGPEQQVKLLKVIETGEFEPVGSNQTLKSQARLVVASNLDLQPMVDEGRFRPDLYYRLNMLKFEIPPLRKRRMDIIPLAKQFIHKFQEKHEIAIGRIDDSLLEALVGYPWPGNVRELENVIQRAVIYCRDGKLTAQQLPAHILSGAVGPTNDPSIRLEGSSRMTDQSLSGQVALTEKEIIEQALFQNNYSKTKTAQALGISRVTLYNKLKKYKMPK